MARYYFHIRDGFDFIPDDEGMELPDFRAAWAEADASADDIMRSGIRDGVGIGACAIEIADEMGAILGSVKVAEQRKLA